MRHKPSPKASNRPSRVAAMLRRAAVPAAALSVMAFFGIYAVLGTNGILAFGDYRRQLERREQDFVKLDQQREMLKNRVALLDPRHANPDMVDELVRKKLNVTHPDEVIVPMN